MMDNYDLVACLGSVAPGSKLVHKMEREEESCGGVPRGERDRGAPNTSAVAGWDVTAEEHLSEDDRQRHWAPRASPGGGPEGLAMKYPKLCPGWCEAKPGAWAGAAPRELPGWGRREQPLDVPEAGSGGLLICGTCGQSFEDQATLRVHQREHLRPAPSYECTACGKVFRHHRNLLTHKKHRGRSRHACAECGRTFCLKGDLLRHRAGHAGEGGYVCPLCGETFRHKRNLQAHRKGHAGDALHKCPECGKRFEDEAGLSRHRAAHCEERPFVCGRCDRSFSWKESLMIHQRSHTQERSHKCPDCGRSFSRSGNLLMHQRVHTGERPFACAQCDKAFCNKANLITHKKLHRRFKSFACSECQLGFSSKSKLLLHQQAHGEGDEVPVTFEDVAVSFSPEEWAELAEWQQDLYWDVMRENYELVASLGADQETPGPHPDLLSQLGRGEELRIEDLWGKLHVGNLWGERAGGLDTPSTGAGVAGPKPALASRLERGEERHAGDGQGEPLLCSSCGKRRNGGALSTSRTARDPLHELLLMASHLFVLWDRRAERFTAFRAFPRCRRALNWEDDDDTLVADWEEMMSAAIAAQSPCVARRFWSKRTSAAWRDRVVLQPWDGQEWLQNFHRRKQTFLELREELASPPPPEHAVRGADPCSEAGGHCSLEAGRPGPLPLCGQRVWCGRVDGGGGGDGGL
ncbi:zinc finger protein 337-like isoform X2 [Dromaius novaehollandiae]|uniref:zinc finger protein 337-like isoform X2 n=1 Tax=Dromaius novaehollandiae TaxID=8790 RepID=UPI00311EBBD0